MNFILNNEPEMALLNHPLFVEVQRLFPNVNIDINSAIKGQSLKSLERGEISIDDYIIGNMFKKVRDDLGFNPTHALKTATFQDLKRNSEWSIKTRKILDSIKHESTALGDVLFKARDIVHDLFSDFDPWLIEPRITFGATEFLGAGEDLITRLRSANSDSLKPIEKLPNGHALIAYYLYKVGAVNKGHESSLFNPETKRWESIPRTKQTGQYVLFASVGKTALIDRPIGYHEPLQLAIQCGIGDYHFKALKKVGIDMSCAQDVHKELVQLWSIEPGVMATMDQSNASQNILYPLVEFLYPKKLFDLMDAVRPAFIRIDDKDYPLDMMSAQGNGFNTGMQTVVYYALLSAIAWYKGIKTRVYQYGDDSIFHAELFDPATKVLSALGFQINVEKSFSGHVLESCGMDAIDGLNVRPFYVKTLPNSARDWYHVCNGIMRVGYINNSCSWRSINFKRLWLWCIGNVPANQRYYGPIEYGDNVLSTTKPSKYCYNKTGNKIRAFGTSSAAGKRIFSIATGLSASNVFTLLPAPSLRGSGLRFSNKLGHYYPQVVGNRDTIYGEQWLPYPVPMVKDNENMDKIFSTLKLSGDEMVSNYNSKLYAYRWMLTKALRRYANQRMDIESEVDINLDF